VDARQRRSRARLHAAVLRLAAERAIGEVTATEIAAAAGVHRSTFYEHASSPGGLLESALEVELDQLREDLLARIVLPDVDVAGAINGAIEQLLAHVERHAEVYRRGLGADAGTTSLHPVLGGHLRGTSRRCLELLDTVVEVPVDGLRPEDVTDAALAFLVDGTIGVISTWLERPDLGREGALRLHAALVPSWWPLEREELGAGAAG
jgi:AcrR family transcriptional regulator